jgi:hypothetical protein
VGRLFSLPACPPHFDGEGHCFSSRPTHKTICAPPRTAFETSRSLRSMCVIMVLNCALLKQLQSHHVPASVNISAITVLCTFIRSLHTVSLRPRATVQVNYSIASRIPQPPTHTPTHSLSQWCFCEQRALCAALPFCLENKSSLSAACAFQCERTRFIQSRGK